MDSKERIAQTAFSLFTQNGYKATSIAELIAQSQVSKGGFYHHFKSKQEVYEYVIDYYFMAYYKEFDWKTFDDCSLDEFKAQLTQQYIDFVSHIKQLTQNRVSNYFILFFEAYNLKSGFKDEAQKFYTNIKEILITKLMAEKKVARELALREAVGVISKFEGFFFWLALFPEEDITTYFNS